MNIQSPLAPKMRNSPLIRRQEITELYESMTPEEREYYREYEPLVETEPGYVGLVQRDLAYRREQALPPPGQRVYDIMSGGYKGSKASRPIFEKILQMRGEMMAEEAIPKIVAQEYKSRKDKNLSQKEFLKEKMNKIIKIGKNQNPIKTLEESAPVLSSLDNLYNNKTFYQPLKDKFLEKPTKEFSELYEDFIPPFGGMPVKYEIKLLSGLDKLSKKYNLKNHIELLHDYVDKEDLSADIFDKLKGLDTSLKDAGSLLNEDERRDYLSELKDIYKIIESDDKENRIEDLSVIERLFDIDTEEQESDDMDTEYEDLGDGQYRRHQDFKYYFDIFKDLPYELAFTRRYTTDHEYVLNEETGEMDYNYEDEQYQEDYYPTGFYTVVKKK